MTVPPNFATKTVYFFKWFTVNGVSSKDRSFSTAVFLPCLKKMPVPV